jgi:hypothetical protein
VERGKRVVHNKKPKEQKLRKELIKLYKHKDVLF